MKQALLPVLGLQVYSALARQELIGFTVGSDWAKQIGLLDCRLAMLSNGGQLWLDGSYSSCAVASQPKP